jgi:hypothetical protein
MSTPIAHNVATSAEAAAAIAPRAEFRVFGHDLIEGIKSRMWNGRTVLSQIREMPPETYFLSTRTSAANVKVRDGLLDIKVKTGETAEGYEIFQPRGKFRLPIGRDDLAGILSHLRVEASLEKEEYGLEDLVALAHRHPDLAPVGVEKRRYGFTIDGALCEYALVYFNGALLESACVESEDHAVMRRVVAELGLAALPNVNYLEAAKRVVGLS